MPMHSMAARERAVPHFQYTIIMPPSAPSRQTKAPQERSMLPPVSMHISIPTPKIYTYAF